MVLKALFINLIFGIDIMTFNFVGKSATPIINDAHSLPFKEKPSLFHYYFADNSQKPYPSIYQNMSDELY